jgi:hypothetical protein
MILHLCQDDKFLDTIVRIFETAYKARNNYVVWHQPEFKIPTLFHNYKIKNNYFTSILFKQSNNNSKSSSYLTDLTKNIKVYPYGSDKFFDQIGDLSKYKLIIFHSLVYNHAKLANIIIKKYNIPVIWFPFGYEVYNMLSEFRKDIYLPETKKLLRKTKTNSNILFDIATPFKAKAIKKAISQIDFCALAIDTEFELYKKILNPNLKQVWFSYYPLDYLITEENNITNKPNILIGNSAFPTNNHSEIFNLLSKMDFKDRKLITPLNYGNQQYAKKIKEAGYEMFGNNFHPLLEFLKLDEYNKIVNTCGVVIMSQLRQQAFGNILTSLWFGAKVFLHPQNTIYKYLKDLGIYIYSIEEIDFKIPNIINNLSAKKTSTNKNILKHLFSLSNIILQTKKITN